MLRDKMYTFWHCSGILFQLNTDIYTVFVLFVIAQDYLNLNRLHLFSVNGIFGPRNPRLKHKRPPVKPTRKALVETN